MNFIPLWMDNDKSFTEHCTSILASIDTYSAWWLCPKYLLLTPVHAQWLKGWQALGPYIVHVIKVMMDHTTWALFEAEVRRNHEHFKKINEDRNSITIKKKDGNLGLHESQHDWKERRSVSSVCSQYLKTERDNTLLILLYSFLNFLTCQPF